MNDCASMTKILKVDENLICTSNLPFFHIIVSQKGQNVTISILNALMPIIRANMD